MLAGQTMDGTDRRPRPHAPDCGRYEAASDGGAEHWAVLASLIETCKRNEIDPQAYLADVLSKIVGRHPMSRIDELLPFAYIKKAPEQAVA